MKEYEHQFLKRSYIDAIKKLRAEDPNDAKKQEEYKKMWQEWGEKMLGNLKESNAEDELNKILRTFVCANEQT